MSYTFKRQRGVHKGETKYYNILMFRDFDSGRGVVVKHWGKISPGMPMTPKAHGKCKVEYLLASCEAMYRSARSGKEKRGYQDFTEVVAEISNDRELEKTLGIYLKSADAVGVMAHLTGDSWAGGVFDDIQEREIDDDFVAMPINRVETEVIDRGDNWGSW